MICVRLGWPVLGLMLMLGIAQLAQAAGRTVGDDQWVIIGGIGYGFLLALPINTYYQVRAMLRRSMPDARRTRGPIAVLRALGTTVCVLAFIGLVLPFLLFGACLLMMSGAF